MEANLIRYVDGCFQISMLSGLSKLNLNNEVVEVVETGKDINILIPWKLCYQHISSCGQMYITFTQKLLSLIQQFFLGFVQ